MRSERFNLRSPAKSAFISPAGLRRAEGFEIFGLCGAGWNFTSKKGRNPLGRAAVLNNESSKTRKLGLTAAGDCSQPEQAQSQKYQCAGSLRHSGGGQFIRRSHREFRSEAGDPAHILDHKIDCIDP